MRKDGRVAARTVSYTPLYHVGGCENDKESKIRLAGKPFSDYTMESTKVRQEYGEDGHSAHE